MVGRTLLAGAILLGGLFVQSAPAGATAVPMRGSEGSSAAIATTPRAQPTLPNRRPLAPPSGDAPPIRMTPGAGICAPRHPPAAAATTGLPGSIDARDRQERPLALTVQRISSPRIALTGRHQQLRVPVARVVIDAGPCATRDWPLLVSVDLGLARASRPTGVTPLAIGVTGDGLHQPVVARFGGTGNHREARLSVPRQPGAATASYQLWLTVDVPANAYAGPSGWGVSVSLDWPGG